MKRSALLILALCLSCILVVSCKSTPPKTEEPEGSPLGRAQEEGTPPVHDIEHPTNKAQAFPGERIQSKADSTPTPTPNRAIDRPLDPVGKPLTSPTP